MVVLYLEVTGAALDRLLHHRLFPLVIYEVFWTQPIFTYQHFIYCSKCCGQDWNLQPLTNAKLKSSKKFYCSKMQRELFCQSCLSRYVKSLFKVASVYLKLCLHKILSDSSIFKCLKRFNVLQGLFQNNVKYKFPVANFKLTLWLLSLAAALWRL